MAEYGLMATGSPQAYLREMEIVEESLREFSNMQSVRANFGMQWEECASIGFPTQRNTFFFGNYNYPGIKKTQLQVDATVMLANVKFAAIVDSMMTPFSSAWHNLEASNPYVQKDRASRLWLERLSKFLADMRYEPMAGFRRQNQAVYQSVGAFGNGPLFIDQLTDMRNQPMRGWRYKAVPLGEVFIRENHQGIVDGYCRWFRLTGRQAMQAFEDGLPEGIQKAAEQNSQAPFDFLHRVCPNADYDPERPDAKGMTFASYYISLTGKSLLRRRGATSKIGGYRTFPMPFCRYAQGPGEPYGRGWMMDSLPSAKTLNSQKTTFLKQGHRAADPVLLSADDGGLEFSLRPGAMNPGTMNADGKPLIGILPTNPIAMTKEMMDEEKAVIGEASLTTIFTALVENPNMTATQVVELINQKGIYLAPMAGSMAPEYLGMILDREIDMAMDLYPELAASMPPLLKEAKGEYKVVYTSPLFLSARAGDAAGFLRTLESALQVAQQTADPSHVDYFDFETAWPEIAHIQNVPESWMTSPDKLAQIRKSRADQVAQKQQVDSLPNVAAMLKAKAAVAKAGLPAEQNPAAAPA